MGVFKFDYKKPEDLGPSMMLLTPGDATFKITGVFDKKKDGSILTTMSGDPKLRISLFVVDSLGGSSSVYDDLTSKMAWKIKALLESVGLGELYDESGSFDPTDIIGTTGKCVIDTRKSEGYEDSTVIKKYVKAKQQKAIEPTQEPSDDDIPF